MSKISTGDPMCCECKNCNNDADYIVIGPEHNEDRQIKRQTTFVCEEHSKTFVPDCVYKIA